MLTCIDVKFIFDSVPLRFVQLRKYYILQIADVTRQFCFIWIM